MLVTLNTLFARSKRQKKLVLSCVFTHLEIAVAAVRVAEYEQFPLLLTLDTTRALTAPDTFLIPATLLLARSTERPVAVEVLCESHRQAIERAFHAGATVVTPSTDKLSRDEAITFVEATSKLAAAFGAECVLSVNSHSEWPLLAQTAFHTGVQAVRILPSKDFDPLELTDLARTVKVPLIAEELELSPSDQRKLSKTGVAAVTIGKNLDEAYTAGLRTGLHDRSAVQPAKYLRPANLAVEDTITNLLHYLKT